MIEPLSSMGAKDVVSTIISALAFLLSTLSLWRTNRTERENAEVRFEQKRQEASQMMLQNEIANERRLRVLEELVKLVTDATLREQLRQLRENMRVTMHDLTESHHTLRALPRLSSPKALAGLESILGAVGEYERRSVDTDSQLQQLAASIRQAGG